MSTDFDIRREMEDALAGDSSMDEIWSLLREFHSRGVSQDELLQFLENLRASAPSEQYEDRILEVMDLVSGFCREDQALWGRERTN